MESDSSTEDNDEADLAGCLLPELMFSKAQNVPHCGVVYLVYETLCGAFLYNIKILLS